MPNLSISSRADGRSARFRLPEHVREKWSLPAQCRVQVPLPDGVRPVLTFTHHQLLRQPQPSTFVQSEFRGLPSIGSLRTRPANAT